MALSNVITFNLNRDQLIQSACSQLGVDSSIVSATNTLNIQNFLNMLLKQLELTNIHMWEEVESTLFLTSGQSIYNIGPQYPNAAGDNTIETTLLANGSVSTLTLTSIQGPATQGIQVGDNIGVVLDNGDLQWSTIQSINTANLQVVMNAALTSTASAGAQVFTYTNTTSIPLNVSSVRYNSGGTERICYMRGRDEFMMIAQKFSQTSTSQANQVFYVPSETFGTMYIYPTPSNSSDRIHFSYSRTLDDFTQSTDNADLPQAWLLALVLNLSVLIAPIFGKDLSKQMPLLVKMAEQALTEAQMWDVNAGSVRIVPGYRDDC